MSEIIMKTLLKKLLIFGLFFQLLMSPAFAGSDDINVRNETKTNEYITQLKKGANPDKLTRPKLRRHKNFRVKKTVREMVHAMDDAEKLARAGKRHLIKTYEYDYFGNKNKKSSK